MKKFLVNIAALGLLSTLAACGKPGDVPYVPTEQRVVTKMLELGEVGPSDVVYDLGSGDGRIPISAVKDFGASQAVGIEIDPDLVALANENARLANVQDRVRFIQGDIFEADFSDATVVTLYLWPKVNIRLRPRLLELKPGTRIVSHSHDMGEWKPEKTVMAGDAKLYFWRVPEKPPA